MDDMMAAIVEKYGSFEAFCAAARESEARDFADSPLTPVDSNRPVDDRRVGDAQANLYMPPVDSISPFLGFVASKGSVAEAARMLDELRRIGGEHAVAAVRGTSGLVVPQFMVDDLLRTGGDKAVADMLNTPATNDLRLQRRENTAVWP